MQNSWDPFALVVCITPGPNQFLYASDAFPGRVYKLQPDGKVRLLGRVRQELKQSAGFTKSPARRKTNLRRRIAELAFRNSSLHPKNRRSRLQCASFRTGPGEESL